MNDDIPWPRPGRPLSPASLLGEIDDVVYDLLEHEQGPVRPSPVELASRCQPQDARSHHDCVDPLGQGLARPVAR